MQSDFKSRIYHLWGVGILVMGQVVLMSYLLGVKVCLGLNEIKSIKQFG